MVSTPLKKYESKWVHLPQFSGWKLKKTHIWNKPPSFFCFFFESKNHLHYGLISSNTSHRNQWSLPFLWYFRTRTEDLPEKLWTKPTAVSESDGDVKHPTFKKRRLGTSWRFNMDPNNNGWLEGYELYEWTLGLWLSRFTLSSNIAIAFSLMFKRRYTPQN